MTHSTFRQPLPPALLADMSSGYLRASAAARPYEFVGPAPAGSLAATGDDMARFMIAHLKNGAVRRGAHPAATATARQMHAPQAQHTPPLTGMALGFYHEDRNGHVIIGHAGDTEAFHSDLHLLLNDDVGLFISMNSAGKEGAAHTVRGALLDAFMDRYYPVPVAAEPTVASAKADAAKMAGTYWSSRRVDYRLPAADQPARPDQDRRQARRHPGRARLQGRRRRAARLARGRPFVWKDASGQHMMAAALKDGKVAKIGYDFTAAFMVLQPVPVRRSVELEHPAADRHGRGAADAVVLWPIQALVRRRHGAAFPLSGTHGAALSRRAARRADRSRGARRLLVIVVQMTGDEPGAVRDRRWTPGCACSSCSASWACSAPCWACGTPRGCGRSAAAAGGPRPRSPRSPSPCSPSSGSWSSLQLVTASLNY